MTNTPSDRRVSLRRLPEWMVGLLLAFVVTALGFWALGLIDAGDDPSFDDSSSSPDTAGVVFELFDGTETSFDAYRGTPVVLNFWASWCPPCVAEMPDFQSVYEEMGDQVAFVGMNSQDGDRSAAERLVADSGVTYQLASDPDGDLFARFGGIGMPTTVFIDADGNIVATHSGILVADELERTIRDSFDL